MQQLPFSTEWGERRRDKNVSFSQLAYVADAGQQYQFVKFYQTQK
jgi:hypothetical protein